MGSKHLKKEATLDAAARKKYLTGFSARKAARKAAGKKRYEASQKKERVAARGEERKSLKQQYKQVKYAARKATQWGASASLTSKTTGQKMNSIGAHERDTEDPASSSGEDEEESPAMKPELDRVEVDGSFYGPQRSRVIIEMSESLDLIDR